MKDEIVTIDIPHIQDKIYTIRDVQVMLDRDLASFYGVETRALKQSVRRNIDRFPSDFMFILTESEIDSMVSQSVIPSKKYFGGAKPFAFTEQGVAMLAAVIKSKEAIEINIKIMRAFVQMRKFISRNALIFQRLDKLEFKQLHTDKKLENILKAIEKQEITPKQGVFFEGQIFDAHKLLSDIIKSAKISIMIIDNYIDDNVLTILTKKNKDVNVSIYTKNISAQLKLDVDKYNRQYGNLKIIKFSKSHDRFIIIDRKDIYHIGASLKDLGKKWFAFTKFDNYALKILEKINSDTEK